LISDHLAWQNGTAGIMRIFPFPRPREALGYAADNLCRVQDLLGRTGSWSRIPSLYIDVLGHEMPETIF